MSNSLDAARPSPDLPRQRGLRKVTRMACALLLVSSLVTTPTSAHASVLGAIFSLPFQIAGFVVTDVALPLVVAGVTTTVRVGSDVAVAAIRAAAEHPDLAMALLASQGVVVQTPAALAAVLDQLRQAPDVARGLAALARASGGAPLHLAPDAMHVAKTLQEQRAAAHAAAMAAHEARQAARGSDAWRAAMAAYEAR